MKKFVLALFMTTALVGCSSTPYTLHVKPTPLVAGESKYELGEIKVDLVEGPSGPIESNKYANQDELTQQFIQSFKKHLHENNQLATSHEKADAKFNATIIFRRMHHSMSDSLTKPEIMHSYSVTKGDTELASSSRGRYTTKYSYFKDLAVNTEIIAGNWDEEDEPIDVDYISKLIVNEVVEIGQ